jgi:uncharacterized protein with ATP-grasp and redox domains
MSADNGPVDPFSAQKQSLLDNLRPVFEIRVLALMRSVSTISDAISVSLLGNKGDLSLHSVAASLDAVSSPSSLVILQDQHCDALPLLKPTARVAIILDNCGIELVSDLMLAVLLLQSDSCASVTLLCKKRPVWVSDALEKDILEHMAWAHNLKFEDEDAAAANAKFVAWFRTCLFTNRIRIIAHEFLSGPEAFDEMPAELTDLFETCSLVICKGILQHATYDALGCRSTSHTPQVMPIIVDCSAIGMSPRTPLSPSSRIISLPLFWRCAPANQV